MIVLIIGIFTLCFIICCEVLFASIKSLVSHFKHYKQMEQKIGVLRYRNDSYQSLLAEANVKIASLEIENRKLKETIRAYNCMRVNND